METIYASKGLKKMFIAQIGAAVCLVLALIPIINLVAAIAALAFSILNLIGLYEAGKNIEGCKTAFMITIANIVLNVVTNIAGTGIIPFLLSIAGMVLQFLVTYFVCTSVAETLRKTGSEEIARSGDLVWKINLVCYLASIVISVLVLVPLLSVIAVLANYVVMIATLVASILFLIFLYKSSAVL